MTPRVNVMTFLAVLVFAALAQAQTFTTLYDFTGGSDGGDPVGGVIQDPTGNLYGTTFQGGPGDCSVYGLPTCGVVFKVTRAGAETVPHSFSGPDGATPYTGVVRDSQGNLYGTTHEGGLSGLGAVFKIDTAGSETVLYSFTGGSDGCYPEQGVVVGKSGTLFGTTSACGLSNYGTIFKVDSAGNFTLLHSFAGGSSDGADPIYGHLAIDKAGNLYGLTSEGGSTGCLASLGCGVLYKLSKSGMFTLLHSFAGGTKDGCEPYGSVVQDKAGDLYGTTYSCGSNGYGTIWKVSKKSRETILHSFAFEMSDGCLPYGGVTRDSNGNLYGVTSACGTDLYFGTLYELSTNGTLSVLHSFDWSDGDDPLGEVLRTANGTLFGTTFAGGGHGYGTVWKYVP